MNAESYTKSDVMRALSMVEAPLTDTRTEADNEVFNAFNAGAGALASVILDGLDADQAKGLKAAKLGEIAIGSLVKTVMKRIADDGKGLL